MALPVMAIGLGLMIGPIVARVLGAVGMGVITYYGVTTTIDRVEQWVEGAWGNIGADVAGVLAMAGFDQFITIVISAYGASIGLRLVGGAIKRIGFMPEG